MGPSDISSLLSRANSVYNSFKHSMRRNSIKHQTAPPHEDVRENRKSVVSDNSLLDNLMRELSVQNEILFQVSKALTYCRTMKGFETSVEFIEAEKILLIACKFFEFLYCCDKYLRIIICSVYKNGFN